ncbi:MAG: lipoate--protein ligase family protein [Candidatus Delongbacteria bacterium]|nr:lipoate--protein ligase family protein [Candidatus Delongbacteria bacterium]MBN2834201.1 lipoate--protein ligase family protein [Candidatus Delongbacteria bacterium]
MSEILFIDSGVNTGRFNMACDYHFARNGLNAPIFRVYRWKPYCISLGYHQKIEEIDREKLTESGIDIVRRETGGRAVYHADELTYSMIIPQNSEFYSDSIMEVYNRISTALVDGLKRSGVEMAELERGEAPDFKGLYKEKLSSICFSSTSTFEVVAGGKKLVGSAQKRMKGAVLQHGSMLVGNRHLDLIDYLNISDKLKSRFKEQVGYKTTTVENLLNIREDQFNEFYVKLTDNLKLAIKEIFGVPVIDYYLTESDRDSIKNSEQYFVE